MWRGCSVRQPMLMIEWRQKHLAAHTAALMRVLILHAGHCAPAVPAC